jgi:DnaJ-domain-containing protein 1
MAAADMNAWRRQNSDIVHIELELVDGSTRKGTLLLSRDKSLREMLNAGTEAFFDFDYKRQGPIVLAKSALRSLMKVDLKLKDDQDKINALAARKAELEKLDPYHFLGVAVNVDSDGLHQAYIKMARTYHPDRFADANLPPEVMDYLNAMARRINGVYEELVDTRDPSDTK